MDKNFREVAIIGGGASGMAAAIECSKYQKDIIIFEKNERLGKKLIATGNGRCNFTNKIMSSKKYNDDFVKDVLNIIDTDEILNFFKSLGIEHLFEGNRAYPRTLKANTVLNLFLRALSAKNIEILTNSFVKDIKKSYDLFEIITDKGIFYSKYLLLATGSKSFKSLGSDDRALMYLKKFGHEITDLLPSLCKLNLKSIYLKHLQGTKVRSNLKLFRGDELIEESFGEILFTKYGISGPSVLDISKFIKKGDIVRFSIINDLYNLDDNWLYDRYYALSDFTIEEFLMGLVDKKFIHVLVRELDMDKNHLLSSLDIKKYKNLIRYLLEIQFEIISTTGFEDSQVTSGGISLNDINSKNLSSKLEKNLYIIGEAMDVDGICGGYNLHWAFASGIVAGRDIGGK